VEFDWTTFILEIINFLVLVWILKRFLYQPVLNVIDKRRAGIEKLLADAQQIEAEAKRAKQQNEQQLADWEKEKKSAQTQLMTELVEIRESKMAALEASISGEAGRRRVLDERRRREYKRMAEEKGIAQGAEFSTKLLSRLASPELEAKLFGLLLEDLHQLRIEDKNAVKEAATEVGLKINVQSVFPLDKNKQDTLSSALAEVTGRKLTVEYSINPELISGYQVDIGPWVLHANLRDELKFFRGVLQHAQ
jgi:F-type H+-transporting ATPase subunit b